MKSLTKKVLSLAMAIAMVGSFAVSAASVTVADGSGEITAPESGTTVTVPYAATGTGDQLTVIAYAVADEADDTEPADGTIVYINQYTIGTDNPADAITFDMRDTYVENGEIKDGVYKVIMGGTGVEIGEANTAFMVVGGETATIVYGDIDSNGVINIDDVTAVLNDYLGIAKLSGVGAVAADVDSNGAINIDDVTAVLNDYLGIAKISK